MVRRKAKKKVEDTVVNEAQEPATVEEAPVVEEAIIENVAGSADYQERFNYYFRNRGMNRNVADIRAKADCSK